jgi:hypothetical protein
MTTLMPLRGIDLREIQMEEVRIPAAGLPCHGGVHDHLIAGEDVEDPQRSHELL